MIGADPLVATYDPKGYADPVDLLDDYQRFLEYTAEYPDAGRTRIAAALEIPEGRARSWKDGSIPDAIRGLQFAQQRGWTTARPDDEIGRALCVCFIGVTASGSIDTQYQVLVAFG